MNADGGILRRLSGRTPTFWSASPFEESPAKLRYRHLQAHEALHGSANVSAKYVSPDGYRLGNWVAALRQSKSKRLLSDERASRIEALSDWVWDPVPEQWEEGFRALQTYASFYGNTSVPAKYVATDGYRLRAWVQRQRNAKSSNLLSEDRATRLEGLPGWVWNILPDQWEDGFKHLLSYVSLHGNARVPAVYSTPDGYKLGNWVTTQRQNKSKNLLGDARAERIAALPGWAWDQCDEGLRQLQSFVARSNSPNVPGGYVSPDGYRLGGWVQRQRNEQSSGHLSKERIDRLEVLPGWKWWS